MRLEKVEQLSILWLRRWKKEDLYSDYKTKLGSTKILRFNTSEYNSHKWLTHLNITPSPYFTIKSNTFITTFIQKKNLWKVSVINCRIIFIYEWKWWEVTTDSGVQQRVKHLSPSIEEVQILKRYFVMLMGQKSVSNLYDWNNI